MTTVIGILLIIMAVFLVISVLMQSSKDHRLSGSIAGGAETFFGKTKGKSMDAMFNKLTTVISIIFVVLVIVLYVIQPETTVNVPELGDDVAQEEVVDDAAQNDVATEDEAEVAPEGDVAADDGEAVADDATDEAPADDAAVSDEVVAE